MNNENIVSTVVRATRLESLRNMAFCEAKVLPNCLSVQKMSLSESEFYLHITARSYLLLFKHKCLKHIICLTLRSG